MKRIITFISVFILLLTSCTGEQGPRGFPGINADEYAALSFEAPPVNFQFFNDTGLQEAFVNLPFDILDSDVVLVYRLDEVVTIDGFETDAWSPLPQNFFLGNNDIIQYVFNHTFADVKLIIDGNFNLATLGTGFTQNQIFRIIILPADALGTIDTSDINNVIQAFEITEF
jgi:hypothetical protein